MHQFNTSISFLSHSILQPADRDLSVEAKGSTQKCAKVSGITTGAADAAPASAMIAACAGVGGFMISASLTPKTRTSGGQGCAPDTIVQGVTYYCKRVADASVQVHAHFMYTVYINLDTFVCHTHGTSSTCIHKPALISIHASSYSRRFSSSMSRSYASEIFLNSSAASGLAFTSGWQTFALLI